MGEAIRNLSPQTLVKTASGMTTMEILTFNLYVSITQVLNTYLPNIYHLCVSSISLCHSLELESTGGWGSWSSFSPCSSTCGGGTRTRTRECKDSTDGGAECEGESSQSVTCNTEECPYPHSCKLQVNGAVRTSIQITSTSTNTITVWGSSNCSIRILAVGGGGGE